MANGPIGAGASVGGKPELSPEEEANKKVLDAGIKNIIGAQDENINQARGQGQDDRNILITLLERFGKGFGQAIGTDLPTDPAQEQKDRVAAEGKAALSDILNSASVVSQPGETLRLNTKFGEIVLNDIGKLAAGDFGGAFKMADVDKETPQDVERTISDIQEIIPGALPTKVIQDGVTFDIITPREQVEIDREARLDLKLRVDNLKEVGGRIKEEDRDKFRERAGFDPEQRVLEGGGETVVDENGNRVFRIFSDREFARIISEKKFSVGEVEHLAKSQDELIAWTGVIERTKELGIGPDKLDELGDIEFDVFESPFGPISLPARFNLVAQFAKDPRFKPLKDQLDIAFQVFRIRVTGVQASDKELKALRPLIANMKERPAVFFEHVKALQRVTLESIQGRLDLYEDVGRDTGKLRERFGFPTDRNLTFEDFSALKTRGPSATTDTPGNLEAEKAELAELLKLEAAEQGGI